MTFTEKRLAEFDEEFVTHCSDGDILGKDGKNEVIKAKLFLTASIQQAEQLGYEKGIKAVELPVHNHANCPIKETCIGYQNAESDLSNVKEQLLAQK